MAAGKSLTFSATVSNAADSPATIVALADTLPAGTTLVSATPSQGSCSHASGTVTCNLGSIASGASATASITVTVPAAPGSITNKAGVTDTPPDPNTADNSASTTTMVQQITLAFAAAASSVAETAGCCGHASGAALAL